MNVIPEKSDPYSELQEELITIDNDLVLISAYQLNGQSLFFFMKDENDFRKRSIKLS